MIGPEDFKEPDDLPKFLNQFWCTIPNYNLPTYEEFNTVMNAEKGSFGLGGLHDQEANDPRIGVFPMKIKWPNDEPDKNELGVSTLSLIASITAYLHNEKRLACIIDEPSKKVLGFTWYENPSKDVELANLEKE